MRLPLVLARWSAIFALFLGMPASSMGDGSALYKTRCAHCHGRNGEGKTSIKAPSLVSEEVKSMSDDAIKEMIQQRTNGEMERRSAHTAMKSRLNADQITELVDHIRKMQKR